VADRRTPWGWKFKNKNKNSEVTPANCGRAGPEGESWGNEVVVFRGKTVRGAHLTLADCVGHAVELVQFAIFTSARPTIYDEYTTSPSRYSRNEID
jgi:hypothetical protein